MEYGSRGGRDAAWTADRVRALRRHMGMTQREFSDELGTRQQTISEWETGLYSPRGISRTALNMIAERAGFEYGAAPPEDAADGERTE